MRISTDSNILKFYILIRIVSCKMEMPANESVYLYKSASVIKFVTPGHMILDIQSYDGELETDADDMAITLNELTKYWKHHHTEPVEGRMFLAGEIVSVEMGSWRPALITGFRYDKGVHLYELLLLDCGQLVEVHRMQFRHVPPHITLNCRYTFFFLMDILPCEAKSRAHGTWTTEACYKLRHLFSAAKSTYVAVIVKQKTDNYWRVFGNIFLEISNYIVDVRSWLLASGEAFEDAEAFRRSFDLNKEDFVQQSNEDFNGQEFKRELLNVKPMDLSVKAFGALEDKRELEEVKPVCVNIKDEDLDKYIPPEWGTGGSDPLSNVERRRMCRRLQNEADIYFRPPDVCPSASPSVSGRSIDVKEKLGHERNEPKTSGFEATSKSCAYSENLSENMKHRVEVESRITFSRPHYDTSVDVSKSLLKTEEAKERHSQTCRSKYLFGEKTMPSPSTSKYIPKSPKMSLPKPDAFDEKYQDVSGVQVVSDELSKKIGKLFVRQRASCQANK